MTGAWLTPINHEGGSYYAYDPFELRFGHGGRSVFHRRNRGTFWREVKKVDGLANLVSMLDYVLDSKRKRHITGGIMLSVSLLFGGLALTVMTINDFDEEDYQDEQNE